MAYDPDNLSVISYANGFTLWHYRTTVDAITAVPTRNGAYLKPAHELIRSGDVIILQAGGETRMRLVTDSSEANGVVMSDIGTYTS